MAVRRKEKAKLITKHPPVNREILCMFIRVMVKNAENALTQAQNNPWLGYQCSPQLSQADPKLCNTLTQVAIAADESVREAEKEVAYWSSLEASLCR